MKDIIQSSQLSHYKAEFERYANARFAGILLKGYHSKYNPGKDYKTAKQPIVRGFTSEGYPPPSVDDLVHHIQEGGWVGYRLPPGIMVIDNEDPDTIAEIDDTCKDNRPPTQRTNNGKQWTFSCHSDIRGADGVYTRSGLRVTYRLPVKNYVIMPPINGRTWEYEGNLEAPPPLPDKLLPYRKDNKDDLLYCIGWEIHRLKKADIWGSYEELLSMSVFFVEIGIPDENIHDLFKIVFGKSYDQQETGYFLERDRQRIDQNEPVIGTGTFFESLKNKELHDLKGFAIALEKVMKPVKEKKAEGKEDKDTKEKKELYSASFPGLVDVVVDEKGQPSYLIKHGDDFHLTRGHEIDGIEYTPPSKEHLPFELPKADQVKRWYRDDDDGKLFEDVYLYLKRFSYINPAYRTLLTCYVFCTYIQEHPDIYYLAEIVFYAPPEYGKSRTGKAIISIAYRGIHLVTLKEANVFRYSQNLQATIFFDIKSLWKKAEKNDCEDVLLLRFEKGAKASRVIYPERGPFRDTVYYDIFGPTIIATNEAIHNILDTRAINIPIPNKPGNYENLSPLKGLELKERLTAWRARMMGKLLPMIDPLPGVQGRLRDISEPLIQVCALVQPKRLSMLQKVIQEVAGQRIEDKRSTIEGQIVTYLKDKAPDVIPMWEIKTSELVSYLNEDRSDRHKLDSRYIGKKLNSMGIVTRISHGKSIMTIRRGILTDLINAYTMQAGYSPNSPNSPTQEIPMRNEGVNEGERQHDPVNEVNEEDFTHPAKTVGDKEDGEFGECGELDEDFLHEEDGIPNVDGERCES